MATRPSTSLLILVCIAVAADCTRGQTSPSTQAQSSPPPQQEQMVIETASRKTQRTLAELQRDSSTLHLRLIGEIERAQRHAEVQQEQARLDLATKVALAMSRLGKGSEDQGPQLRQAFTTELTQACQAFNQRLAEIDAEQNQSNAQAVQRFHQQKNEVREGYAREVLANAQRVTQELAAPDMGRSVASFKASLPPFAQPATEQVDTEAALQSAYRAEADAAEKTYTDAVNEARTKVVTTIQRSLETGADAADEEQVTAIKNSIKRLGLWAADAMDTYQLSLKGALRKYQLGEEQPRAERKSP